MTTPVDNIYYSVKLSSFTFTVPKRYERLEYMCSGTFSAIARAHDRKSSCRVVIKKLARPFQDVNHARRAYRELHLLSAVSHPNLISLLGAFSPQLQAGQELQDIYIVTPQMDCDLSTLIAQRGRFKSSDALKIAHGILCALRYLHSANILHRDLKPANVALTRDGGIKILDFGLARSTYGPGLTRYVCTRNYRSPEVLLCCSYDRPADIWSVGCIFAEAVLGRVLFTAESTTHLLKDICHVIGKPANNAVEWVSAEASGFIAELDIDDGLPEFIQIFDHLKRQAKGPIAFELLWKMLTFDPKLRITAEAALAHPALAKEEKQLDLPVESCYIQSDEDEVADLTQLRAKVVEKLIQLGPISL